MDIDLSIVVVSYNTKAMTEACLDSVYRNLCRLNAQVILVDNDSKDGSVDMVRERFPQVELIANADNRGFAKANNQGFALCKGEYILLLNSDTVVLDDVLQRSVEYAREHRDVGAFGCRVLNTDRTMQPTCSGFPTLFRLLLLATSLDRLKGPAFLDGYLLRRWKRDTERDVEVISGCYMLIRREVLEQVGGLDERFFFFGEETDWCLRMRQAGWRLVFAPVGEIIHHGGGSVRKLAFKRDVMLTDATVRLHAKHGGRLGGILAFLILFGFNSTRALYWSLMAWIAGKGEDRAVHFRQVTVNSLSTWPKA